MSASAGHDSATTPGQHSFSPLVCACFTLNYIIGGGFLSLPWAFYEGGLLLSSLTMVMICTIANLGCDYLLSAMARANLLLMHASSESSHTTSKAASSIEMTAIERHALLKENETLEYLESLPHDIASKNTRLFKRSISSEIAAAAASTKMMPIEIEGPKVRNSDGFRDHDLANETEEPTPLLMVGETKIDLPELFHFALAEALPNFRASGESGEDAQAHDVYAYCVGLFGLIVVPMSLLELNEQVAVQLFLSGCRFLMIFLMVATPLIAWWCQEEDDAVEQAHFGSQTDAPLGAPWIRISGVHQMMPIAVFAVVFHYAIPGLADEMSQKSQLTLIFRHVFVLCGIFYIGIGVVGAWYFGPTALPSGNLNWSHYHAGTGHLEDGEWIHVAWWAKSISFYVLIFPALDVISAFPLSAFCLGNSLMSAAYGDSIHEVEHVRGVVMSFRALASVPPIIGSIFIRNLGTISSFAGLIGLIIAFIVPAVLYLASERKCKAAGLPYKTCYQHWGSSPYVAMSMVVWGTIAT
eukprot:scaffold183646_cov57-Attheya_sp.AAC.2